MTVHCTQGLLFSVLLDLITVDASSPQQSIRHKCLTFAVETLLEWCCWNLAGHCAAITQKVSVLLGDTSEDGRNGNSLSLKYL